MTEKSISIHPIPGDPSERLSLRLGLHYLYYWPSNQISEDALIRKILTKYRFNDVMRMAYYYGLPRLRDTAKDIYGTDLPRRLSDIFNNIEIGFTTHVDSE